MKKLFILLFLFFNFYLFSQEIKIKIIDITDDVIIKISYDEETVKKITETKNKIIDWSIKKLQEAKK